MSERLSPGRENLPSIKRKDVLGQEGQLPSSVDFMLLGKCNLACSFCFGPQHEMSSMPTEKIKSVIKTLSRNGVERIVFTGGEPTLIKDLPEILSDAKKEGLFTVLSTNGLALDSDKNLLGKLAPSLDWIALPLDGSTLEVNSKMRVGLTPDSRPKHFDSVFKVFERIRREYPQLKIKLGTVVAKPNLEDVQNIPFLLQKYGAIPDTWKLYQVSPSEYGRINYPELEIGDREFRYTVIKARRNAEKAGIKHVVEYSNATRPGKYLFINPVGEVLIVHPEENDYRSIGNILFTPEKVFSNWKKHVDQNLLQKNFEETYSTSASL